MRSTHLLKYQPYKGHLLSEPNKKIMSGWCSYQREDITVLKNRRYKIENKGRRNKNLTLENFGIIDAMSLSMSMRVSQ